MQRRRKKSAGEFDAVHSVERAREVGSLREIVESEQMRAYLIQALEDALQRSGEEGV